MSGPTPLTIKPPEKGIYFGAFVNDVTTEAAVTDFEKMSGQTVDIALKFLAFSTGLSFPTQEAAVQAKRGGTMLVRLEPWSWKGADDKSFTLENLIAGKYDRLLQTFADGAKKFGKPVFVSFGHEMNGTWYPWCGNPDLYVKAYKYVHDKISKEYGADNLTWVWNPNIDLGNINAYYPGSDYVDWVAADGYNTEDFGGPWRSCQDLFGTIISELERYNKPIMIGEFGSDANTQQDEQVRKPEWLNNCVSYFATGDKVKAFIYFNIDKKEEGKPKEWAIDTPAAKEAFRQALSLYEALFKSQVLTGKIAEVPSEVGGPVGVEPGSFQPFTADFPRSFRQQSVTAFIEHSRTEEEAQAKRQVGLRANAEKNLKALANPHRPHWPKVGAEKDLAESEAIEWIHLRNLGKPALAHLDEAFKPRKLGLLMETAVPLSIFWKGLLSMILFNDRELAPHFLTKLGLISQESEYDYTSRAKKLDLLVKIHDRYLAVPGNRDPKLLAQNYTERALLLWTMEKRVEARGLKSQALAIIDDILNPAKKKQILATIKSHFKTASPKNLESQYAVYQAKAKVFKAKLILMEIEDSSPNDEAKLRSALKVLGQVHQLMAEASTGDSKNPPGLEGFELLETYLIAGQALIRQAFIIKQLGTKYGPSYAAEYKTSFKEAYALLGEVVRWEKEYGETVRAVGSDGQEHPWVKILTTQANFWITKIPMIDEEALWPDEELGR